MPDRSPLVTILLPTYQCEAFVAESIRSLLDQTFTDFELLMIDDASTDGTVAVIETFQDPRIRLLRKPRNSGYTDSLNAGIGMARGTYIARMDADDISLPTRLEKQVRFLNEHPEVVLCGTWYQEIPGDHVAELPSTHDEIRVEMVAVNSICHPSVMFRKDFFVEHNLRYDRDYESAEDYELWTRLVALGRVHNLPEVLLHYRMHPQQVTSQRNAFLLTRAALCRKRMVQYLSGVLSPEDERILDAVLAGTRIRKGGDLVKAVALLNRLIRLNAVKQVYLTETFTRLLTEEKKLVVRNGFVLNNCYNLPLLRSFLRLKGEQSYLSPKERLSLFVKCLIGRKTAA